MLTGTYWSGRKKSPKSSCFDCRGAETFCVPRVCFSLCSSCVGEERSQLSTSRHARLTCNWPFAATFAAPKGAARRSGCSPIPHWNNIPSGISARANPREIGGFDFRWPGKTKKPRKWTAHHRELGIFSTLGLSALFPFISPLSHLSLCSARVLLFFLWLLSLSLCISSNFLMAPCAACAHFSSRSRAIVCCAFSPWCFLLLSYLREITDVLPSFLISFCVSSGSSQRRESLDIKGVQLRNALSSPARCITCVYKAFACSHLHKSHRFIETQLFCYYGRKFADNWLSKCLKLQYRHLM